MCKYNGLNICHCWHSQDLFCVSLRNKSSVFSNTEVLINDFNQRGTYNELKATSAVRLAVLWK